MITKRERQLQAVFNVHILIFLQAINTLKNASERSKFTMETFGQTMLLEADPSILTPLTLSASSIATLGNSTVPPLPSERESVSE